MKQLILATIKLYQLSRFVLPASCRFYPSCSDYSYGSIDKHGLFKGFYLTVFRLLRCHPFNPGGVDEVPEKVHLGFFCFNCDDFNSNPRKG
ncbi:MAG: membrane protein insertion efficiency factor YidD [Candidatus Obscuribacterales bacterium]|nr:membrane protein insertion efficiency factor YidD [Candidatus Obscuribacterales bacterium]